MTLEADLKTLLDPFAAGRVYPDEAPEGVTTPYITYQQMGGKAITYTSNDTADTGNARMQINVWADTRLQASSIARQIEDAMHTSAQLQARALAGLFARRDVSTGLYGTSQDFSIWYAR